MTKICRICKQEKETSDFYIDRRKNLLHTACKKCDNKKGYASLKANPCRNEKSKEQHRINHALRRKEMAEKVDRIKIEKGCFICGYKTFIVALNFHHLDPSKKEGEISNMVSSGPSKQIELFREIEKCVVLCRNCHRALHAGVIQLPNTVDTNSLE